MSPLPDAARPDLAGLLAAHAADHPGAAAHLVGYACERFEALASRMLRGFPGVRRWEQTGDVLHGALLRLHRALAEVRVESEVHFHRLVGEMLRRELLNLARRYGGPNGHGRNHWSDGAGAAADDPGGPLARATAEPGSPAEWADFHDLVAALPSELAEVVRLTYYDGLTQEDAARLLGVDVRTVKRRVQRAKLLLADRLGAGG